MQFAAAFLLALICIMGWFAQLVALPGNWLIVLAAALYAWFAEPESRLAIDWYTVAALLAMAIAGEVLETAAGAAGVKRAGGSRRGALLAIAGSMVGSIVGLFVGVPIPIVGSLVAAVLFGALAHSRGQCSASSGRDATSTAASTWAAPPSSAASGARSPRSPSARSWSSSRSAPSSSDAQALSVPCRVPNAGLSSSAVFAMQRECCGRAQSPRFLFGLGTGTPGNSRRK